MTFPRTTVVRTTLRPRPRKRAARRFVSLGGTAVLLGCAFWSLHIPLFWRRQRQPRWWSLSSQPGSTMLHIPTRPRSSSDQGFSPRSVTTTTTTTTPKEKEVEWRGPSTVLSRTHWADIPGLIRLHVWDPTTTSPTTTWSEGPPPLFPPRLDTAVLVTAYFQVPSKFPPAQYQQWLAHFLSLQDPMIIFTQSEWVQPILRMRQQPIPGGAASSSSSLTKGLTVVVELASVDSLPLAAWPRRQPYNDTHRYDEQQQQQHYSGTKKNHSRLEEDDDDDDDDDFWPRQLARDPERKRHASYQLFWIWLSKSWFVQVAMDLWSNTTTKGKPQEEKSRTTGTIPGLDQWRAAWPVAPTLYMWSDMGCFRQGMPWLGRRLLQYVPDLLPDHDTVVWMAHHPPQAPPPRLPPDGLFWDAKLTEKTYFYHSGSQAVGHWQAWRAFHERFGQTLDGFVQRNLFVGEDQCVLQSTCWQYPQHCAYVPHDQVPQDNHYFGLRTVVSTAGLAPQIRLWRPPPPGALS